jgi:hypothetical protein
VLVARMTGACHHAQLLIEMESGELSAQLKHEPQSSQIARITGSLPYL